ncbi:deoxyribonuclease-1-like [Anneissia japonica]|uniref:deoxyribonuclease-1-like n=1 Tax=Anneissia japonica TaxID=1529436 RepID=UPI0014255BA2|nr:deoxyribonuclease-1-like [Anneissia japonica]
MASLSFLLVSLCLVGILCDSFAQGGLDIAAFNIQIFGRAKMDKPEVVDVLVQIINRYDLILVQEIRDTSGEAIEQLVEEVNKVADDPYDYVIGSRVGRTKSKEQYAFIYRSDEVEVIDSYEYDDGDELSGDDLYEREPFIVRLQSNATLVKDFVIVGIHTKPTNAVSEIDSLVEVYDDILNRWNTDLKGKRIKVVVYNTSVATSYNMRVADDPYDYVIGSRVGRKKSKEQYAFIYRSDEVEVIDSYEYDDGDELSGDDLYEREPFIVRFQSNATLVKDFVIVGIHTKPMEAVSEIDSLVEVYDDILNRWNTDNVLFAGDMNADCSYVPVSRWPTIRLRTDDRFKWLIDDGVDTTTSNTVCAYDRFVAAGDELDNGIRNGSVKVFDFDEVYGLSDDLMMDVSDHFPIELELLPDLNLDKVLTTPSDIDSGYPATMYMYPTMHLVTFAAVVFNYYANC